MLYIIMFGGEGRMKKLVLHLLLVLQIGGGFMGFTILVITPWDLNAPPFLWVLRFLFIFIFLFGVVGGLALTRNDRLGVAISAAYQALQIPVIWSSSLTYSLLSGAQLGVGYLAGRPVLIARIGARCTIFFSRPGPWGIGVNILALCLTIYLSVLFFRKTEQPSTGDTVTGTEGPSSGTLEQ